jgi:hypothetical protein
MNPRFIVDFYDLMFIDDFIGVRFSMYQGSFFLPTQNMDGSLRSPAS